jgi:hypothetical protein
MDRNHLTIGHSRSQGRREFLRTAALLATGGLLAAIPRRVRAQTPLPEAVERAYAELWKRLVDKDGIIHDYAGEIPTPEDCSLGRPNAIGWRSPLANGTMFTRRDLGLSLEPDSEFVEHARRQRLGQPDLQWEP